MREREKKKGGPHVSILVYFAVNILVYLVYLLGVAIGGLCLMLPDSLTRIWVTAIFCLKSHLLNESEEACPGPTFPQQPTHSLSRQIGPQKVQQHV